MYKRQFHHRVGLTRFLPARLSLDGAEVAPIAWRGSSDVPAMTRANAFLVVDADRPNWRAGDWIRLEREGEGVTPRLSFLEIQDGDVYKRQGSARSSLPIW